MPDDDIISRVRRILFAQRAWLELMGDADQIAEWMAPPPMLPPKVKKAPPIPARKVRKAPPARRAYVRLVADVGEVKAAPRTAKPNISVTRSDTGETTEHASITAAFEALRLRKKGVTEAEFQRFRRVLRCDAKGKKAIANEGVLYVFVLLAPKIAALDTL